MRPLGAVLLPLLLAATVLAEEDAPAPRTEKVAEWSLEKTASSSNLRFGPTGRWLLVGWARVSAKDGWGWLRFQVTSLPDQRRVLDHKGPHVGPNLPAFDRCGRLLAYGLRDGKQSFIVKVLDLESGEESSTPLSVPTEYRGGHTVCGISEDGHHVALRSAGPLLRTGVALDSMAIFDLRTKKEVVSVPESCGEAATFGDGFVLYRTRPPGRVARGEYRLKAFDLVKGREAYDLPVPVGRSSEPYILAPDGRSFLLRDDGGRVIRYVPSTGKTATVLKLKLTSPRSMSQLTLSANGQRLAASVPESRQVVFCDPQKGERSEFGYAPKRCRLLGMSSDGRHAWLATSTEVGVYDIVERKWREPLLTEHAATAQIDPTGRWLLTVQRKEAGPLLTLYRITP